LEILSGFYVKEMAYKEFDSLFNGPCFNIFSERPEIQKNIYKESIDNDIYIDKYGYSLKDHNGKYQNVNGGIRKTCYKNLKKNKRIYVFGGSTVEGVGVSDCETIPSYLQKNLVEFDIVNMGVRGNFSVTEERRFLRLGPEKGSISIFFDGLNDNFYDFDELDVFKDQPRVIDKMKDKVRDLNLYKAIKLYVEMATQSGLPKKITNVCVPESGSAKSIHVNKEMKISSHDIAKRYLNTKGGIKEYCVQNDIRCIFIVQPLPSYKYSQKLYFYDTQGGFSNRQAEYAKFIKEVRSDGEVIDLSGSLDGVVKAYIDKVHYSSYANEIIAKEMAKIVTLSGSLN